MERDSWVERFQDKITIEAPGECWLWTGCRDIKGYGQFWLDGKVIKAHRAAWMLEHGTIPPGQCVCHACDCPTCVNPSHLWLGTNAENAHDRDQKKRRPPPRGTSNGRAKVTEKEVSEIRNLYKTGQYTQKQLGKCFGLSEQATGHIIRRRRWAWLGKEATDGH